MNSAKQPCTYPDILFTHGAKRQYSEEDYIQEHVLCCILTGEMRIIESSRRNVYQAGNILLLRRNLLVKCEKRPLAEVASYSVIFILLKKEFLQEYAIKRKIGKASGDHAETSPICLLDNTPAIRGLFQSLVPYMEQGVRPSSEMSLHKREEAVLCILEQAPQLSGWLFDVPTPEKLDLQAFMQRNYMFNVSMSKFAELTGRSLSTFQRDFNRVFGMPATGWLLKQRLAAAHAALLQPGAKPSDVYLEVGFEDLAHFSRTFKKRYGYPPSKIQRS